MSMILLVGDDDILLRTRAAVLSTTGSNTVTTSFASALIILNSRHFDLLVLCHSLSEQATLGIIAQSRSRWPTTPILRMTSVRRWESPGMDESVEVVPSADPDTLVRRISELLAASIPAPSSLPSASRPGSGVLPQNP